MVLGEREREKEKSENGIKWFPPRGSTCETLVEMSISLCLERF